MRRLGLVFLCLLPSLALVRGRPVSIELTRATKPIVLRGARIHTAEGAPIENGVLVIQNGRIVAVGPADSTKVPADAEIINAAGKVIIPGLVDTHSHIGIFGRPNVGANADGNEGSGAVQPALRALDAVQPDDPGIKMAVAGGVTTANIMPGSGNVIGGQTVYVKLRGETVEAMRLIPGSVLGGLKMANGENPKRFNFERGKMPPGTRMKLAALQREQFVKAREYQRQWAAYKKDPKATPPDRDIAMEPLVEVLERKRTVHFHSHRADDLLTAIRLSKEFDFELVIQHGTEGYRVTEELVKNKIPVSLTLVDSPGGKAEVAGLLEENGAILEKAGVLVAINTDDSVTESRFFLRTGSIALRGGMTEDAALKALTINGAKMLHLDDRLGSLAKGKDADFVVLSGAPFSIYSQVLETWIDGVKVFDRAKQLDWSYQTGGFALADRTKLPPAPPLMKPLPDVEAPKLRAKHNIVEGAPARFAVLAGRLHTVSHGTILDGIVVVKDGKIEFAGKAADLPFKLPDDLPIVSAAIVTPGLIDAHSVVPLSGAMNIGADQDQDEMSDPNQADLRVMDAFNPNEPLLEFLRQNGVTVVHAVPGRNNVIAGQTGVFRTAGRGAEAMALRFPAGILVNLGETPKHAYTNKLPTTRMGTASLLRNAFAQAQANNRKIAAAKGDDKKPAPNAELEALGLALERKIPVIFAAHRSDDLATALRIAKEFNLNARLDLATEGYLMADALAEAKVPIVVHPTMQRASSMETYQSQLCNAAVLAGKKIPLAIGTGFEGYVPKTRSLRHEAAVAMVHGLGHDRALAAVTLEAAKILGIDDRYGSLEAGKVADLVLYDGDCFEHSTHVTHTVMGGRVVFDRAEYLKLPFERLALPLVNGGGGCCLGEW